MDPIVIPMFFIAAVALASVCFIVWVAVKLVLFAVYVLLMPVRWVFGMSGRPPQPLSPTQVPPQYSRQGTRCGFRNCMALNPPNARFCGRCGSALNVWGGAHYHYPPRSHTPARNAVNYVA